MEFRYESSRIFVEDGNGRPIAEVTFPETDPGIRDFNHTFVDDSLRGQGIAAKLVKAAAEKAREDGKKVRPSCSYAVKWFEKNPDYADLLA